MSIYLAYCFLFAHIENFFFVLINSSQLMVTEAISRLATQPS